jgi:hypothetical protein
VRKTKFTYRKRIYYTFFNILSEQNKSLPAMKHLLLLAIVVSMSLSTIAQVTTASISGTVNDQSDSPLIGATIVATHAPSGTQYGITTRSDGDFTLPNLRVGGPYTIVVSYIGFQSETIDEVYLTLGQKFKLDVALETSAQVIDEVVISANQSGVVNKDRTGAATNVTSDQLTRLPTISRSASDFTRLTPAADGNSFAGRNDQFNNFSLDG